MQVSKYTTYLYTTKWCFILWMPIDHAGCSADKGIYLCWAGGVKRHKESGQQALPLNVCGHLGTALPLHVFAIPVPSLHPTSSPHSPGVYRPQGSQWHPHHCPCCQLWRSVQASTCPQSWSQQERFSFRRRAVNINHHTPASGMLIQSSPQISPTAPSQLQEPKGSQAPHLHGVYNSEWDQIGTKQLLCFPPSLH